MYDILNNLQIYLSIQEFPSAMQLRENIWVKSDLHASIANNRCDRSI